MTIERRATPDELMTAKHPLARVSSHRHFKRFKCSIKKAIHFQDSLYIFINLEKRQSFDSGLRLPVSGLRSP